jgi:hypothetical protein
MTPWMSYEGRLNALTRLIILTTAAILVLSPNPSVLYLGILSIGALVMYYYSFSVDEGFKGGKEGTGKGEQKGKREPSFSRGTAENPLSNVLLIDIHPDPTKSSAPPANPQEIREKVKEAIQKMNPELSTNTQLFGNPVDVQRLDQSNRAFFSTPNSRVTSDQTAFAHFLFSDLKYSGKEATPEGAMARLQTSTRYNLY